MGNLADAPDQRNHFCRRLRCQQQRKVLLRSSWTKRPSLQLRGGYTYSTTAEALDRWIARKVDPCEGGGDNETGEMLSQDDEADFMLYQQRLCDRYKVGDMADRLVQIVDRYMPRVKRYPNQVQTMLKKAWKIRKRIRANQKQERKRRKKPDASASPEHDNRAKRQAVEGERMQNMEGERPAVHARKEASTATERPREPDAEPPRRSPPREQETRGKKLM